MTVYLESKNLHVEYTGAHRSTYLARIPPDHTADDVLAPEYFGKLMASKTLTAGDRILVEWQDFSKFGELVVLGQVNSVNQLITSAIVPIKERPAPNIPAKWEIRWIGGAEMHGIFYDDAVKEAGFVTQELAAIRIHTLVAMDAEKDAVRAATGRAKAPAKSSAKKDEKEAA